VLTTRLSQRCERPAGVRVRVAVGAARVRHRLRDRAGPEGGALSVIPSLRTTSVIGWPLARATSASRSFAMICSGVCLLFISSLSLLSSRAVIPTSRHDPFPGGQVKAAKNVGLITCEKRGMARVFAANAIMTGQSRATGCRSG